MAKELSTQERWKPWKGVILFVITLVWLIAGSIIGGIFFGREEEKKAYNNGLFIGFVYNEGKWVNGEPRTAENQAAAVSAGDLREVGIETIFKKVITLTGKASESITAKKYLVFHSNGTVKLSSSSGATETNMVALSDQDANDNVVVGIL